MPMPAADGGNYNYYDETSALPPSKSDTPEHPTNNFYDETSALPASKSDTPEYPTNTDDVLNEIKHLMVDFGKERAGLLTLAKANRKNLKVLNARINEMERKNLKALNARINEMEKKQKSSKPNVLINYTNSRTPLLWSKILRLDLL